MAAYVGRRRYARELPQIRFGRMHDTRVARANKEIFLEVSVELFRQRIDRYRIHAGSKPLSQSTYPTTDIAKYDVRGFPCANSSDRHRTASFQVLVKATSLHRTLFSKIGFEDFS